MNTNQLVKRILFLTILLGLSCLVQEEPEDPLSDLGRLLFFETKLSENHTISCASCHDPRLGFTDGYRTSKGHEANSLQRNAPSLINVSAYARFNWANPWLDSLEKQIRGPLFSKTPSEMGADASTLDALEDLPKQLIYREKLKALSKSTMNWPLVVSALAAYCKQLESRNSSWDRFLASRDSSLLSTRQWEGANLFFSKQANCSSCHGGQDFSVATNKLGNPADAYSNIGLYAVEPELLYPESDRGLYEESKQLTDDGKFRIPSLRNLAFTAPYFHDGSAATLGDVLKHYQRGGRNTIAGPNKGDGKNHPSIDPRITKIDLSDKELSLLADFLSCLNDSSILVAPSFQTPFSKTQNSPDY